MRPLVRYGLIGFLITLVVTQSVPWAVIGGLALWFVQMQIWCWKPCRRCSGKGKHFDPLGHWHDCGACEGRGKFLRQFVLGDR